MDERARLRMTLDRVRDLPDFYPGDRIWWLYFREAVQHWLEKHQHPGIRATYDGVKAFPENLPDERTRWIALRDQVQAMIDRGT